MKKVFSVVFSIIVLGTAFVLVKQNAAINAVTSHVPVLYQQGILRSQKLLKGQGIPILMYHHLLENKDNKKFIKNATVITPEQFAAEMKLLHDHGYTSVTMSELEQYVDGKIKLPKKSVVLTFDDGYLSNYKYAYPILKKYHYKATIFLITGKVPPKPQHFDPNKLTSISWPEIPAHSDVFNIQAHTHKFHRMLNGKAYLVAKPPAEVKQDLQACRALTHADYFSYPYGKYNETDIAILKNLGFRMAVTTKPGYVYPGSPKYELPRNTVYPYTTINQFKQIVGIV
ncbi:polysaccharide deacetylase family protein [Aneurinibacillus terranovensis]|uniref:polysaccharide deacetylase family protein n=1 Tax=Aneurinibacillus terranovensis TaxID=278991 RepID=UPI0004151C9A|nr:polysaccharide deacetylase family protein [Aneurinibacillus terranovensis]